MAITIDWRPQRISKGYDSHCKHHRWSTDVGCLDEIRNKEVSLLPCQEGREGYYRVEVQAPI